MKIDPITGMRQVENPPKEFEYQLGLARYYQAVLDVGNFDKPLHEFLYRKMLDHHTTNAIGWANR